MMGTEVFNFPHTRKLICPLVYYGQMKVLEERGSEGKKWRKFFYN
jgi:hypothetical protein